MRIYYDTEFCEDGQTIDLLSIAMVAEDGRELYLENAEADHDKANDWVRANVLPMMHACLTNGGPCQGMNIGPTGSCPNRARHQIRDEVVAFCDPEKYGKLELWGYYSSYDHVVLCQLFGAMINLPETWPMYTRDLKQWADTIGNPKLPSNKLYDHHALFDARLIKERWEFLSKLEKQYQSELVHPASIMT